MKFCTKRIIWLAALLALTLTSLLPGEPRAGNDPPRTGKAAGYWADAIGDRLLPSWVEKRVHELEVTPAERRLDEIGWAKDIRDALRLAKKHGRPVFLFTHLGRMAIGRC
ncbi:MAG TPA: hypothetical protein VKU02_00685 [Gemmataceae bacterium]|nr:hypothetical protein [Gemmataceae bacterium]